MRSVLHALIWNNFRYAASLQMFMMALCLIPIPVYAAIASVAPQGERADFIMLPLEVSMLPFVIFILFLASASSHVNLTQLALKPISNLSIAAWKLIGGGLVLAVQVSLFAVLYNWLYKAGWPVAGAALFTVALWFVALPFLCLAGKSVLGALVTLIPIGLMFVWFITRYKPLDGSTRDWNVLTSSEAIQLLSIIVVFAWCTMKSVALARRGDALPMPTSISEAVRRFLQWDFPFRERSKPFSSVGRAMFWYEWRWKGWQLAASFLALTLLIVPIELMREATLESFYYGLSSAYIATTVPGMILGVLNGFQLEGVRVSMSSDRSPTRLNEVDEMGSFMATRPVSDAALATSNLWVCLASVGLLTGLWIALAGPVLIIAAVQDTLPQLFTRQQLVLIPLVAAFLWIATSNLTMITSTGRTKYLGGLCVALALGLVAGFAILGALNDPSFSRMATNAWLASTTLGLVAFTFWAYQRSRQLGYVSFNGSLVALLAVVAATLGGCWARGAFDWKFTAGLLCASLLCVLPWAGTPLATRWNRHR